MRRFLATPFWYNSALFLLKPFYRWRIKRRADNTEQYQQECIERFGPFQPVKNRQAIWFHAVSVGETNAAQPLIEHYLKLGHPVLVTNTTKTGQARAKSLFLKAPYLDLFQAVYLPVDQKALVRKFFQDYQPKLLALVETELWPNLLHEAKIQRVPTLLLNARLSEKSAKGYAKVSGLTASMLAQLNALLAQDEATQQRYVALGCAVEKTQVVGNIKFDINVPEGTVEQAEQLRRDWTLQPRRIITIASTHAPEEEILLQELQFHLKSDPHLLCIVVPRHPERFDEVFQLCQHLGLKTQRRSLQQPIAADTQVFLADSMGELWLWYALSHVCFVGGSLNEPGGGHNILEPIAVQIPTIIGPRYFNFQSIVDEFVEEQGIAVVTDASQGTLLLLGLLQQHDQSQKMIEQANRVLVRNKGSLQQHIQIIDRYLIQQ